MASLLAELKRRNVFRVAFAYLILGWLVLQFTDIVAPALRLPEWTVSLVTFFGIIGFPFAILFTWAFEMTPEGLKRSHEVHPEDSITHETSTTLNRLIIALMALAIVALLVDRFLIMPLPSEISTSSEQAVEAADAAPDKPRSIAVLPFVNMSADAEQEYFSDGISEELLNGLARIGELRVAARTSSFAFKGKNQDITEIGKKLKVETVLEGSVRKSGQRIRITAQLINVADGYHLWSDTYDRDLTDIFVIQDEISAAIVDALRIHLTDSETGESAVGPVSGQEVQGYEFFLLARYELRKRSQESIALANTLYDQSLAASPGFAPAMAGKALAVLFGSEEQYGTTPHLQAAAQASDYARQALAADPNLTDAHGILGLIAMGQWEMKAAVAHFDHAISINPNQGILYSWRGNALAQLGRAAESRADAAIALELDPRHPVAQNNWMVRLMLERKFEEVDAFYQAQGDERSLMLEAMYADTLAFRGAPVQGYTLLQRTLPRSSAAEQADYRLSEYELNNFKQTSLPPTLLPQDRWSLMSRWESPDNVRTMASMISLSSQNQLKVLIPHAAALIELGQLDDAWAILQHRNAAQRVPCLPSDAEASPLRGLTLEVQVLQRRGQTAEAAGILNKLQSFLDNAEARGSYWLELERARIFAVGGQPERALEMLERAYAINTLNWYDRWDPEFMELRDHPRFITVFADLDADIDAQRAKLGWPPAEVTRQ